MSKESLARATNSQNMEMESGVTHDADRVAAMAGGNTLGGLLLRYRESAQPRWGHRIVLILGARIVDKYAIGRAISNRVALAALQEWHDPHCTTCRGAREFIDEELKLRVVCKSCHGSGKQLFSDTTRRMQVGTYGKRIAAAFYDAHGWMSNALASYMSNANARLA